MKAIERIQGYACEVDEDRWRELVKVADEVKANIFDRSWTNETEKRFVSVYLDGDIIKDSFIAKGLTLIPYPDFLAKLKGEEKWEPKNGEEVEVSDGDTGYWYKVKFVGRTGVRNVCMVRSYVYGDYADTHIRPLRHTITRAEADQKLKELGVIARIVD